MNNIFSKKRNRQFFYLIYTAYLLLLAAICLAGALWFPQNNSYEGGATVYFPKDRSVIGNEFEITGSAYALAGVQGAKILLIDGDNEFETPVEFEKIFYKDRLLMQLSTFKTTVTAPHDGEFTILVQVAGKDGTVNTYANRTVIIDSSVVSRPFKMLSMEHILAMLVFTVIMTSVLYWAARKKRDRAYSIIAIVTCTIIAVSDIGLRSWLLFSGTFRASYDMALHMCDISGFLMPVLLFAKPGKFRDWLYNLMFIWGIGGAMMAILTPEMGGYNFPSFYFFNFFIKHGAIVFGVLFITFMKDMRPKLKSLPLILLISNMMIAVIYGINQVLQYVPPFDAGNYLFISYPPTGGSAIDIMVNIFGPSPWYIIGMNILGVIVFVLLWAPFAIEKSVKKKRPVEQSKVA